MELTVNITGLDKLAEAITLLAQAGTSNIALNVNEAKTAVQSAGDTKQNTAVPTAKPVVPTAAAPQNTPPVQNAQSVPVTQSAPTAPAAQNTTPAVNPVPTSATAPTYTVEQLAVAATGLIDAGKMQGVQNALATLGAQTLMDLPQEKYGEFASAIKAMGAVI